MIIKVEEKHIRAGKKNSYKYCPVALAIKEQAGENGWIFVGDLYISYRYRNFVTPRSVYRFICRFDEGKKVKPFNFKLDI